MPCTAATRGARPGTAILIPITFSLDATGAIIMLAAIYYGAMYGGAISSITLGIPGRLTDLLKDANARRIPRLYAERAEVHWFAIAANRAQEDVDRAQEAAQQWARVLDRGLRTAVRLIHLARRTGLPVDVLIATIDVAAAQLQAGQAASAAAVPG